MFVPNDLINDGHTFARIPSAIVGVHESVWKRLSFTSFDGVLKAFRLGMFPIMVDQAFDEIQRIPGVRCHDFSRT
jgi:hypothetical protein